MRYINKLTPNMTSAENNSNTHPLHISTKIEHATLFIHINRPEAKNALSCQMYQQLTDALIEYEQNGSLKAAVFYGSDTCFTAGNDLKDFMASGELNTEHPTVKFLYQIANCKKPLIAAVAGPAIGIGTTLLLHCDLVVAADNAIFQLPFAQLGLCPELASSVLLPKLVGYQQSFELLVLGDKFNAEKALSSGFVNKITSSDNIIGQAKEWALKLSKLPAGAVQTSKSLIRSESVLINKTIETELAGFQRLLNGEDAQTIIGNFFKR